MEQVGQMATADAEGAHLPDASDLSDTSDQKLYARPGRELHLGASDPHPSGAGRDALHHFIPPSAHRARAAA